jgi:hypothetical protein
MAEVLEHVIVDSNFSRDATAADDVLLEKFLDSRGAYVSGGLCLNLFCEILNRSKV